MWIAVTGAQGSGKSTIVRALVEQFERRMMALVPVQGIGAFVGALKFPLGESATRDTISAFILEHVRRERHAPRDAFLTVA
jgi:thymidylate kinase